MRLSVVGTGYVGLVVGAGFAETGNDVTCIDVDADRIARLRRADIPIFEPGLHELVEHNAKAGRLRFETDFGAAVPGCEVVFLAVGTPSRPDGSADLSALERACDAVAPLVDRSVVVAIKSTVPVGSAERIEERMRGRSTHPIAVVSNPEFLKEGDAVNDFTKPARVIVGTSDDNARQVMRQLYTGVFRTSDRIIEVDRRSAELCKYAANAMLAARVSFMNEMALLCEKVGADIEAVRKSIGTDPRIGPKHLYAGPGFGGSCLPKDLNALAHVARDAGSPLRIVEATIAINDQMRREVAERVLAHFGTLRGRTLAVWGLAFKARTDDMRESPSCSLIDRLLGEGATVAAHDPAAIANARSLYENRIRLDDDPYEITRGADALCVMTDWAEYRNPDFARLKGLLREPVLFDGRNLYSPSRLRELGFRYYGLGRGHA